MSVDIQDAELFQSHAANDINLGCSYCGWCPPADERAAALLNICGQLKLNYFPDFTEMRGVNNGPLDPTPHDLVQVTRGNGSVMFVLIVVQSNHPCTGAAVWDTDTHVAVKNEVLKKLTKCYPDSFIAFFEDGKLLNVAGSA